MYRSCYNHTIVSLRLLEVIKHVHTYFYCMLWLKLIALLTKNSSSLGHYQDDRLVINLGVAGESSSK